MKEINLSPEQARRFWSFTRHDPSSGCLEWTGGKFRYGYGGFRIGGSSFKAHRIAWVLAHGQIPEGLFVCHRCDNPPCVFERHLFLGDAKANLDDMRAKGRGRWRSGDMHGIRLHPERAPIGARNGQSKLTDESVQSIRKLKASGVKAAVIAAAYGIHPHSVDRVCRDGWRHLAKALP